MNLINQSNFGDCTVCNEKDTPCRKRGKVLICLQCCKTLDNKKQLQRVTVKNQVRGLMGKQQVSGNQSEASRSALILDIDYFYSRYLRLREADEFGNIRCYICNSNKAWSFSQVMHFIPRACIQLRFFPKNTRCGCSHCNVTLNGNLVEYAKKLNEEEEGLAEWLKDQSRQVEKPTLEELKGLLVEYKQKYKMVESKFTSKITHANNPKPVEAKDK